MDKKTIIAFARAVFYFFTVLTIMCFQFGEYEYTYQLHWFLYASFSTLLIADLAVRPVAGYLAGICFFYSVTSGLWVGLWRHANPLMLMHLRMTHEVPDANLIMTTRFYALDSVFRAVLVVVPIALLARTDRFRYLIRDSGWFIALFPFLSTLFAIYQRIYAKDPTVLNAICSSENIECGGFLSNPSMGACMAIVCAPLAYKYAGKWGAIAGFLTACLATYLAKSSIAYGLLGLEVFVFGMFYFRRWYLKAIVLLSPAVAFAIGWSILGKELINDSHRFRTWAFFAKYWKLENQWFGIGTGTFATFSSDIQTYNRNFDNAWWVWLHNDWLQILFEQGIIGLSLVCSLYLVAIRGAYKAREFAVAMSLFLYGITATMNYPLHLAYSAAIGAWLMTYALVKSVKQ